MIDIVKKMLDSLKGDDFTPEAFQCFAEAFKSVLMTSLSAETLRSLALFITYALQKQRQRLTAPLRSSTWTQHMRNDKTRTSSVSTPASSPRSKPVDSKSSLSMPEVGIRMLEVYCDLLCQQKSTGNIEKFARTVTNKVS